MISSIDEKYLDGEGVGVRYTTSGNATNRPAKHNERNINDQHDLTI
jgi:hypothetical protein